MNNDYEWLIGKVVHRVRCPVTLYPTKGNSSVQIEFTDGSEINVYPSSDLYVLPEFVKPCPNLIEPTLNSDVVPIGTNTLGEGSV